MGGRPTCAFLPSNRSIATAKKRSKREEPEKINMSRELAKATREMERNKRLTAADETYRSRKPKARE